MKNKARDLRCFRGAGDIGFAKNFYFSFLLNLPRPEGAIVIADNTVVQLETAREMSEERTIRMEHLAK